LVLVAAVGVNVITHGLHQSVGVTLGCVATHFPTATLLSQGELWGPRCPDVSFGDPAVPR
jgi:hypothetical protein